MNARLEGGPHHPRVLEACLRDIWAEVLDIAPARILPDDHFFLLGGNSLLLTQVLSRVEASLQVRLELEQVYRYSSVRKMALLILRDSAGHALARHDAASTPAPPAPSTASGTAETVPASAGQAGLWFIQRLHGAGDGLYNTGFEIDFQGDLDVAALEAAVQRLEARHESLRTSLWLPAGSAALQQVIAEPRRPPLRPVPADAAELALLRRELIDAPFNLRRGPPWRARLVRLAPASHRLLVSLHHTVTDAWSGKLLLRELSVLYAACREAGGRVAGPGPARQYREFCLWQQRQLSQDAFQTQMAYWRGMLAGLKTPPAELAGAARPLCCERLLFSLDAMLHRALLRLCARQGLSLYMVMLAAFFLLLYRLEGRTDMAVGSPAANRRIPAWESVIGYFVNTLVLRARVRESSTLSDLMQLVKQAVLGALANQDLPFQSVVANLTAAAGRRGQLFRYMFVFQNSGREAVVFPGLACRVLRLKPAVTHYPLNLEIHACAGQLYAEFEYHRARYNGADIAALARQYREILALLARHPRARVNAIRRVPSASGLDPAPARQAVR